MSSCPLHMRWKCSFSPAKVRSSGAQMELIVVACGENVAGKSLTCAGVRHLNVSRGGPVMPPVSTIVVIFQSPASIPSALASESMAVSVAVMAAGRARRRTRDMLSSKVVGQIRLGYLTLAKGLLSNGRRCGLRRDREPNNVVLLDKLGDKARPLCLRDEGS